jgi:hypothetical protein
MACLMLIQHCRKKGKTKAEEQTPEKYVIICSRLADASAKTLRSRANGRDLATSSTETKE